MIHIDVPNRVPSWHLNFEEGIYFLVGARDKGVLIILDTFCDANGIASILIDDETSKEDILNSCRGKKVVLVDNANEILNESLLDKISQVKGVDIIIASFNQFYYSEREGVQYKYLVDTPELITTYDINVRVGVKNDSI